MLLIGLLKRLEKLEEANIRYLLISYVRRLAGQIDEMVRAAQTVTKQDMDSVNVILDFADQKVVKCLIEGKEHDTTFEQMRDYYSNIYPELITQLQQQAPIEKSLQKLKMGLSPDKPKK